MKVAKVITTSFVPRTVRLKTVLAGCPAGYFTHSQNFVTKESIIELIKLNIEIELKCNPGVPVDLIIVNNDSGWSEGNRFLESINGKELRYGKVHVLTKNNFGRSFGGYNYAFKMLGNNYDYFIFTEDDIVIGRDGYASIGIENFHNTKNCGFVAYQGISSKAFNFPPEEALHAHGGVGLTSASVLNEVFKRYGSLPHADESSSQEYTDIIKDGEVAFTNKIYKLGYQVISLPNDIKLYDFAYDVMRGLDVKRFPSLPEKVIVIAKRRIKQKAYDQKIIRSIYQSCKKVISKLFLVNL